MKSTYEPKTKAELMKVALSDGLVAFVQELTRPERTAALLSFEQTSGSENA